MEINWSTEWLHSLLWVLGVWALVVVGFVLIAWLLLKRARWAKQFWRLSGMYFIPPHSRLARLATDLDRRAIATTHRHVGSAGCPPHLPEQRPVHSTAAARRSQRSGSTSGSLEFWRQSMWCSY